MSAPIEKLEVAWLAAYAAYDAWLANRTPETEAALDRAGDALQLANQNDYARRGVTNTGMREVYAEDWDDDFDDEDEHEDEHEDEDEDDEDDS